MKSLFIPLVRALALGLVASSLFAACNMGNKSIGSDSPASTCTTASDCPAQHVCEEQICQPCEGSACAAEAEPGCTVDADCPQGELCADGMCEACEPSGCILEEGLPCTSDADCPPDQACTSGLCQLVESACVPEPEQCDGVDNDCDDAVDEGAICPNGATCISGQCAAPPDACQSEADCPPGQACVDGACELGRQCGGCAEAITLPGYVTCTPESTALLDAFMSCVCAGACAAACGDNVCVGEDVTSACATCVQDDPLGCQAEYLACANDP